MSEAEAQQAITRRILSNSGWLLAARAVNGPLALLESVLLARALGVELFGTLGIIMTVISVTNRLASFRMNEFVVKYLSDALTTGRLRLGAAALKIALLAEGATSIAAWCLAVALSRLTATLFLDDGTAADLIVLYAFVILSDALIESSTGALQVFDKFSFQAAARVIRKVLTLAGIGLAIALGASLKGVLITYIVAGAVVTVLQVVKTFEQARDRLGQDWWSTRLSEAAPTWRAMRRFALSTNIGAILSLIVKETDLLWLAYFRGPVEAGYYKVALTLLRVPFAATSPLVQAIYPELTRAVASGSRQAVKRIHRQGTRLAVVWVVPVGLVLISGAGWIVQTFFGGEFAPAVPAIYYLVIGMLASNLLFWARPTMLALGKPDTALKITAVNTVLKLALILSLVPTWGYVAQAGILSINSLFGIVVTLAVISRALRDLSKP